MGTNYRKTQNKEGCNPDIREFDHGKVKVESLGLRLVSYPTSSKNSIE